MITIRIEVSRYGDVGEHWRDTLGGPNHGGYGRIYLQREGADQRRAWHTSAERANYDGPGEGRAVNADECPGACMIWDGPEDYPSVDALDAIDNQALGRDMGNAFRQFRQADPNELWELVFEFID